MQKNKKYISDLNAREKQYQYFLFYKYFFKPTKPTIITEGKTDALHIKAALMKYYDKYPNLINKLADGRYEFKLYFFNKTKRVEYFLGIYSDGADTMKNIWNFYNGKHGFANIFSYLSKKCAGESLNRGNPVILLFDNEQVNNKPLRKFLNHTGFKLELDSLFMKLNDNLFLQTIPLIKGSNECEIEDLYSKEVLNICIDGKKFEKIVKDGAEDTYSKNIFSKYILEHYQEIDFENFINLIDAMGGIDIEMTQDEVDYMSSWYYGEYGQPISLQVGMNHLDGKGALTFARIRKLDSDFGRTGQFSSYGCLACFFD